MRCLLFGFFLGSVLTIAHATEGGVITPLFLSSEDGQVYVVQNESVINSFASVNTSGGSVYIANSIVGTADDRGVFGGYYDLNGSPTGQTFTNPDPGPLLVDDVATDGTTLYGLAWFVQDILSYDLDFSNRQTVKHWPTTLGYRYTGIAYDHTDNTLWLSGWSISEIHQVDLSGNLVSSFPIATDRTAALAIDPADGTLWFNKYGSNNLYQYSKTGTHLDTITPVGLPVTNLSGGDIAVIPEPATTCFFFSGTSWLALNRKRRDRFV